MFFGGFSVFKYDCFWPSLCENDAIKIVLSGTQKWGGRLRAARFCAAPLNCDFSSFFALFLCAVLIFIHAGAIIILYRNWIYQLILSFHYITEIMCCAGCRIHVVDTQHRVGHIISVLWSKDLGQAKITAAPFCFCGV